MRHSSKRSPGDPTTRHLRIWALTERELDVLRRRQRLVELEIAASLYVSPATIKTHISRLLDEARRSHRAQLIVIAYETASSQPNRSRRSTGGRWVSRSKGDHERSTFLQSRCGRPFAVAKGGGDDDDDDDAADGTGAGTAATVAPADTAMRGCDDRGGSRGNVDRHRDVWRGDIGSGGGRPVSPSSSAC